MYSRPEEKQRGQNSQNKGPKQGDEAREAMGPGFVGPWRSL